MENPSAAERPLDDAAALEDDTLHYKEAGVADVTAPASDGLDSSVLEGLAADGVNKTYSSNAWIGRVGL